VLISSARARVEREHGSQVTSVFLWPVTARRMSSMLHLVFQYLSCVFHLAAYWLL
jgi:hypothetical protein